MKITSTPLHLLGIFLLSILSVQVTQGQTYSIDNAASELTIKGTSNLHDWEMVSEQAKGHLEATIENNQLTKLSSLTFIVVAESLKSGKGGMDKNAYKALKTDKHKEIRFVMDRAENLNCQSGSACEITLTGKLTIAGTTQPVDLVLQAQTSGNQIVLTGAYDLKMTRFKVDPPKAMFGTITTGDELNISFKAVYTR